MNAIETIQLAKTVDRPAIIQLLNSLQLPTVDLPLVLDSFVVAKQQETLLGSCGLELYGTLALLRSLAVALHHQDQGLGAALLQATLDLAKTRGIKGVYLITNTAANFFEKRGFAPVERSRVPLAIQQTAQFGSVCPSSATVMCRSIF
ncbi:GNAT family N-acetyltransferase [Adhaeribacter swui]|uniref:GNAT family N-acetyltransferase n=1 Tax=Adhaeribacter swui TaxID=2086471 RepID=A0A7G7G6Y4_9BACT|nr:arsenic resistance N-acetyltransferase ArsN2 [Adhaeribacter swui]QNF32918.1 GNAT family N-acetyltransferase [Adhaeribacter swui]